MAVNVLMSYRDQVVQDLNSFMVSILDQLLLPSGASDGGPQACRYIEIVALMMMSMIAERLVNTIDMSVYWQCIN